MVSYEEQSHFFYNYMYALNNKKKVVVQARQYLFQQIIEIGMGILQVSM
jgi:hypothetical protein